MILGIFDFYDLELVEALCEESSDLVEGEMVVFKNADGAEEVGKISYISTGELDKEKSKGGCKLLRRATAHDLQKFETNKGRGETAVQTCKELSVRYELDMQPFYAIYSFDGLRVNIVFTAEDRVDFRELVKDLAKSLQKQIHLKQIGPRDKARINDEFGK